MTLRLLCLMGAKFIESGSVKGGCISTQLASSDNDLRMRGMNRFRRGSVQECEGRGGSTPNEGIGMFPGSRSKRLAQRYPSYNTLTRGSSSSAGIGVSFKGSNVKESCGRLNVDSSGKAIDK